MQDDDDGEFISLETHLATMPETHRQQNLLLRAESMLDFLVSEAQETHGIRVDRDRSDNARRDVTAAIADELRELLARQPACQSQIEGALALCVYHLCLSASDSQSSEPRGLGAPPRLRIVPNKAID